VENEVISYIEMCQREGTSLQKGMNFRLGGDHSVVLMSVRPNAPYQDRIADDGSTLIYEGHDVPKTQGITEPKRFDQPEFTASGGLTENGKFHRAAQAAKAEHAAPERVRVYEKIQKGIWSYNGVFHLVDSWQERDDEDFSKPVRTDLEHRRIIPTWVKLAVWKRDEGKCVQCGAKNELHYDHILPYAKGGTSITPENVQLLCARHNLQKSDKIQ